MSTLFIVEAPAKTKTIEKYLGSGYDVQATVGHFRDLPSGKDEVPEKYRDAAWARLGINTEENFEILYVTTRPDVLSKLRERAKKAETIIIATDDDREGEAIAWHAADALRLKEGAYQRIAYDEVTKEAILAALKKPRRINMDLVHAQETRRAVDRLYGYLMSPVLWKHVKPKLSAGRVQSVSTRMVIDLERARLRFRSGSYGSVEAVLEEGGMKFGAKLRAVDNRKVATSSDFDPMTGKVSSDALLLSEEEAKAIAEATRGSGELVVESIERKPWSRKPPQPFITTTMGKEAGRRFKWDLKHVTKVAQTLYEKGMISYIRTDSPSLSEEATAGARAAVEERFGKTLLPEEPRVYASKNKSAQEAHEAIRPAGHDFKEPAETGLEGDELKLYTLIYERTLASQMIDAKGEQTSIKLKAEASGRATNWNASGRVISEPGFMRLFQETEADEAEKEDEGKLPALSESQKVAVASTKANLSQTKPPTRFDEAGLVQELESRGIGRPSTYNNLVSTIQDRGYVIKDGSKKLIPTWEAFATISMLEQLAPKLVDYGFTAKMEQDLDRIAIGELDRESYLSEFYSATGGLKEIADQAAKMARSNPIIELPQLKLAAGEAIRYGESGAYIEWEGGKALMDNKLQPHEVTQASVDAAKKNGKAPEEPKPAVSTAVLLGNHPENGRKIYSRDGQFGPYVQMGDGKDGDPVRKNVSPEDHAGITMDIALEYLSGERSFRKERPSLGIDPESGLKVYSIDGQFGPYVQLGDGKEAKRANVSKEDHAAGLTLEQALEYLNGGKVSLRDARAIGTDDATGKTIYVRDGQYGPYVQIGEAKDSPRGNIPKEEAKKMTAKRALQYIKAQRVLGTDGGEEVKVALGKNGFYIKKGGEFRDTTLEEAAELTLEQALAKLAAPRPKRVWDDKASSGKKTSAGKKK